MYVRTKSIANFSSSSACVNIYFTPLPPCPAGTVNAAGAGTATGRGNGVARHQKKPEKYGHSWCVCSWLFSCFKKDDPQIGSTNFQNEVPPPPEVRIRGGVGGGREGGRRDGELGSC